MSEYWVRVREQEVDYEIEHKWIIEVGKEGFPPHSREEFDTETEARKRARELRRSLP